MSIGTVSQSQVIVDYYGRTVSQYRNWGSYASMPGVYALHAGYYPIGCNLTQRESIMEMDAQILRFLGIPDNTPIVVGDLGCGTGSIAITVGAKYPHVHVEGITLAPNHAQTARDYLATYGPSNVNIVQGSYLRLPYASWYFDIAIYIESLMHSPNLFETLKEAYRTLKPGGLLHFQEPLLHDSGFVPNHLSDLDIFTRGFCLPEFTKTPIRTFVKLWQDIGFEEVVVYDISANIFPSATIVGDHAALRLGEGPATSEAEQIGRLGAVKLRDLMVGYDVGTNVIGYYVVQGRKPLSNDWSSK